MLNHLVMVDRVEQVATNEAIYREVNNAIERVSERIAESGWPPEDGRVDFHCECGRPGCTVRLRLTPPEYERARAQTDRFVVAPGHESPVIEVVVERADYFLIVDKRPEAERVLGRLPPDLQS